MTDLITISTTTHALVDAQDEQGITLSYAARSLARSDIAENTYKNHRTQIQQIEKWLNGRVLNDVLLSEYLTSRFNDGLAPESIGQARAAVKFVARHKT